MKKTILIITVLCLTMFLTACGEKLKPAAKLEIGQPAPDFTLVDTDSRLWKLADLRGQVVFVNFWATWCPPCREEMPFMQKIYSALPSKSFKMLAILNNDQPAMAELLAEKIGCTFPILLDQGGMTAKAYGITGLPETYIIDKQGILREKFIGPMPWDSPEARQMLMKYIGQ